MITKKQMQDLARKHGTPLFIVDHDEIRKNYAKFKKHLPRVQAYYAVKCEPMPEIVRTLYKCGASFDVASMPEFKIVYENIKGMPAKQRQDWIWDKIIYANPIKPHETLIELDKYRPLVTYDNLEEIKKMKKYSPHAGLCLRIRVSNTGAVVELSSKFGASAGEAVDLILKAAKQGLGVEGISFHVGSQTTNFENYVQAINLSAEIFAEAKARGYDKMNLLDIGGGFPAPYDASVKPFEELASKINSELNRLFPDPKMEILAEPGRFMIATAGTSVVRINGKAVRDGKTCYYVNDGAYHSYSGIIFDHQHVKMYPFRNTKYPENCSVFGPTCDALDVISHSMPLPTDLELGELLYAPNMGAYAHSSSTWFNGFPPAKVVHVGYRP